MPISFSEFRWNCFQLWNDVEERKLPALVKAGWTRHQERCCEASLYGADGAVRSNYRLIGDDLNQPPRLRELRLLRDIFLIAQPPLLIQGGEFPLARWRK